MEGVLIMPTHRNIICDQKIFLGQDTVVRNQKCIGNHMVIKRAWYNCKACTNLIYLMLLKEMTSNLGIAMVYSHAQIMNENKQMLHYNLVDRKLDTERVSLFQYKLSF